MLQGRLLGCSLFCLCCIMTKENRKEITKRLEHAAVHYLAKKWFSIYREIGVAKRGRLRVDLLAMNTKRYLMVIEQKSCWADYLTDTKWINYLPFSNKMYFLIPESLWLSKGKKIKKEVKSHGVGVMVCSDKIRVTVKAKHREVDPDTLLYLLTKMSWKGGIHKVRRKRKLKNYP